MLQDLIVIMVWVKCKNVEEILNELIFAWADM